MACPDICHFAHREPHESNVDFEKRRHDWAWLCAELEDFFLETMRTQANALVQVHKRMDECAKDGDVRVLMLLPERTCLEEFSLSPHFRNKLNEKIETGATRKLHISQRHLQCLSTHSHGKPRHRPAREIMTLLAV